MITSVALSIETFFYFRSLLSYLFFITVPLIFVPLTKFPELGTVHFMLIWQRIRDKDYELGSRIAELAHILLLLKPASRRENFISFPSCVVSCLVSLARTHLIAPDFLLLRTLPFLPSFFLLRSCLHLTTANIPDKDGSILEPTKLASYAYQITGTSELIYLDM